ICAHRHAHLFGEVCDGNKVGLTDCGLVAVDEWDGSLAIRREISGHAFVVMPNHVHALVSLDPTVLPVEQDQLGEPDRPGIARRAAKSVSTLVSGYKGAVTRRLRVETQFSGPVWQTRYYDRIVRSQQEFDTIAEYI